MAEETQTTEAQPSAAPPAIDEAKIAELVRSNAATAAANAVKEALAGFQHQQAPVQPSAEPDYFESLIDNRTKSAMSQLSLKADIANDKADFYSSDLWLEDVDDYLTGDSEAEIKEEKRELKKKLEDTFDNLVKQGKGMIRQDVLKNILFEHVHSKKSKFEEKVVKRSKSREDSELAKAKAAVNIGQSAISSFNAQDVHAMEEDKMLEKFGNLVF